MKKKERIQMNDCSSDIIGVGRDNYMLPTEITMDIISLFPVESILQCKLVCKYWRSIVNDLYFAHMHLRRHQLNDQNVADGMVGFVFLSYHSDGGKQFHFLRYCDQKNDKQQHSPRTLITTIKHHPPVNDYLMVGSCNGLICISVKGQYRASIGEPVYVCNPITREYVLLPSLEIEHKDRHEWVFSGFGYNPSTNEYKVVRICRSKDEPYVRRVQVYTIGDCNGWRNKGEFMYTMIPSGRYLSGIPSNGALYWQAGDFKILAFDLTDEKFQVFPLPPFLPYDAYSFELQVFRGSLCVVHHTWGRTMDVWSFKNNINTNDMKEQGYEHWSWNKEFSFGQDIFVPQWAIALTESGEVLLYHHHLSLFRYDMKTATSEKLG